jgi:hypothetical protein
MMPWFLSASKYFKTMGAASSSSGRGTDDAADIDPELLRPRRPPRHIAVNMAKVEKLIRKQKLAPF